MSAPELAVQLVRRALVVGAVESAEAGAAEEVDQARSLAMRAQAVLAAGLVRISHYVDAVEPALAALALAESAGDDELATSMRLDLAACAREVGEPLLGCALLPPVLATTRARPSVRAVALGRLVGCVAHVARRDDVEDALAEADRLLGADDGLNADLRRMERVRLSVRAAAYHRWYGDTEDAIDIAREGLGQLNRLRDSRPDTARLRAQLVLELACALLDEGDLAEADVVSAALLDEPVRATSAAAMGQLMLAVATRIQLPSGRVERGRVLLDQAARIGARHGLDGLLADALTAVSQLDEQAGLLGDALESNRGARSAEQRRLRATAKAARQLLVTAGAAKDWDAPAASVLLGKVISQHTPPVAAVSSITPPAPDPTQPDKPSALLDRDGLYERLHAVRNGERPVALALVRLVENSALSGVNLTDLASWVRELAPDNAELARSDGSELAVILPRTTKDQAEAFAKTIRDTALRADWLAQANARSISTGVGQSNPDAPAVDVSALLTSARHSLTPPEPPRRPGERTQPISAKARPATARPADVRTADSHTPDPRAAIRTADTQAADAPTADTRTAMGTADARVGDTRVGDVQVGEARTTDAQAADVWAGEPLSAEALAELRDTDDTLRIGRAIINSLAIPEGSGGKRRAATGIHPVPPASAAFAESPGSPATPSSQSPAQETPLLDAAAQAAAQAGVHGSSADAPLPDNDAVRAPAPDAPNATPTPSQQPSRPVGETGGYWPVVTVAATAGFDSAAPPQAEPEAAHGSTYEQTRAELARMMSALESGSSPGPSTDSPSESASGSGSQTQPSPESEIPPSPPSSPAATPSGLSTAVDGRWSFAPVAVTSAPPAEDVRNGAALPSAPSQSIPTPPEPTEVPEPSRRPEVPEPDEPDPIPTPPTEPGPPPPDEPGPASPPSSGSAGRRDRRAERSGDSSTIAGLLAEAMAAYQETQDEDENLTRHRTDHGDGQLTKGPARQRSEQSAEFLTDESDRRRVDRTTSEVPGSRWADQLADGRVDLPAEEADRPRVAQPVGGQGEQLAESSAQRNGRRWAEQLDGESHESAIASSGEGSGRRWAEHDSHQAWSAQSAEGLDSFRSERPAEWSSSGRRDGPSADGTNGAWAEQASGESGRRRHQAAVDTSSVTRDDPAASEGPAEPTLDTGPGSAPDEGFESFDRLFDWRYQSPSSGRHRSPE